MHADRLIRAGVASATAAVLTAAMPIAAHAQAVVPAGASGAEVLTAGAARPEDDDNSGLPVGLLVGLGIVAVVVSSAAVRFRGSKGE